MTIRQDIKQELQTIQSSQEKWQHYIELREPALTGKQNKYNLIIYSLKDEQQEFVDIQTFLDIVTTKQEIP